MCRVRVSGESRPTYPEGSTNLDIVSKDEIFAAKGETYLVTTLAGLEMNLFGRKTWSAVWSGGVLGGVDSGVAVMETRCLRRASRHMKRLTISRILSEDCLLFRSWSFVEWICEFGGARVEDEGLLTDRWFVWESIALAWLLRLALFIL